MRYVMSRIILLLFLLASCSATVIEKVSPEQASELLRQKDEHGLFVLNVHTPYEGEIAGTDAFIEDWEDIAAHQDELPVDKSQHILVYCRSGRMSASAAEQLRTLGYENIYDLEGGMRAWNEAGLPLINATSS